MGGEWGKRKEKGESGGEGEVEGGERRKLFIDTIKNKNINRKHHWQSQ